MDNVRDRLNAALANKYRIERELGGGGMSRVVQATETDLGQAVVIKVVSTSMLEGEVRSSPRFAAVLRRFNLDVERLTSPEGGRSR